MPFKDAATRRAYARQWALDRRALFLEGHVCSKCGSADELEFHHVDPTKKVDHRIRTWSLERQAEELAKCIVLCGSCHDELHASERRAPCGTNSAYRRGCRCGDCRRAHTEANRRSRLLRGAKA